MKAKKIHLIIIFLCVLTNYKAQSFQIFGDAFAVPTVSNATCSNADTCFSLTANVNWQNGAVWDLDTIDLTQPFDATFCMFIGANDSGADGFAFVIRAPTANVYGDDGGNLGFGTSNITQGISPSVAIEFDSFYNADFFDIQEDHTALVLNGNVSNPPAVPSVALLPSGANVEDNNFHNARIVWDPVMQQISMYFDGFLRFTYTNNIIANVFGGNPNVFWGFTASTGGLSNLQQICFPKVLLDLPDFEICEQDSVLISYPMENIQSYTWTDPNGAVIIDWNDNMGEALTETSFYATESGSYTLTVEFNNAIYSADAQVTLIPLPEQLTLDLCESAANLNLFSLFTSGLATNGTWSGPSALTGGHLGTFNPGTNLEGVYLYSSNTSSVCPSDNQVTINYYSIDFNPTINLIPCTSSEYDLEITPIMSNGQTNFNYNWTSTNATLTSSQNQSNATISSNSSVNISITSQDALACVFDTILSLNFVASPQFSLGNDLVICTGESTTISAPGTWDSYLWSNGEISSSITVGTSGNYSCEVSFGAACTFTDEIQLTVIDAPIITLLDYDTISCNPFLVNFSATTSIPGATITWDFGDNSPLSNLSNPSHTYTTPGLYDLTLSASVGGACPTSLFLDDAIHVLSRPVASFTYNIISNDGTELEVDFYNNSINYSNLFWDFNSLTNSTITDTTITFPITEGSDITINLTASNPYCFDQTQRIIEIPGQLIYYVPNTFTPDGNLFNNIFKPIFTEGIIADSYHLSIYNRWGEILFESYNTNVGWDGTYGTRIVKEGIYVWVIEFIEKESKEKRQITGFVNLMK